MTTQTITAPGIYPDHTGKYRCPSMPLTQSGIKILLEKTPLDFITPRDRKTDAMGFGSIVHKLALGKGDAFAVSPYDEYRTKEAREWRDSQIEAGIIPIKADAFADAEAVASIIRERIKIALDGAYYQTEVPFYWQEGETWCAGRLDVWCAERGTVIDPKITPYVHPRRAPAHILNMGWDIQNAWYRRGLEKLTGDRVTFANMLIDPEPPHVSRLVTINEAWRTAAEKKCERALAVFQECMATDTWPGYPDDIEQLDMPAWELRAVMEAELDE